MDEDVRKVVQIVAVGVAAILLLWLGFKLIAAIGPIIASAASAIFAFVNLCISFALVVATALVAAVIPIAVTCLLVRGLIKVTREINKEIKDLKESMSATARGAIIDAGFLGILSALAGLVLYMDTGEFLGQEHASETIRIVAFASVACAICKMLVLIPVRSMKVIGLLAMATIIIGTVSLIIDRYNIVGSTGVSLAQLGAHLRQSNVFTLFAAMVSGGLVILAALYPFTSTGWRRVWTN